MEVWKEIEGFEAMYEVSNFGNVRSLDRYIEMPNPPRRALWKGRVLKQTLDPQGRRCVFLTRNCNKKTMRVATLVAKAFLGPRPTGKEVCHRDDDKERNGVDNLYWGTREDNFADAVRNGHTPHGENNGNAKLTNEQVKFIWDTKGVPGCGCRKLSRLLGVNSNVINSIRKGNTWRRFTGGKSAASP